MADYTNFSVSVPAGDKPLLKKIDEAAKKRGVSRSAFILQAAAKTADAELKKKNKKAA